MVRNILLNRLIERDQGLIERRFISKTLAETSGFVVVQNGSMMDPFYRRSNESPHPKRGRKQHLGSDITGPTARDGSINDPRRGLPVYAAIKTRVSLSGLNSVKVYNKFGKNSFDRLSLHGIDYAIWWNQRSHFDRGIQ